MGSCFQHQIIHCFLSCNDSVCTGIQHFTLQARLRPKIRTSTKFINSFISVISLGTSGLLLSVTVCTVNTFSIQGSIPLMQGVSSIMQFDTFTLHHALRFRNPQKRCKSSTASLNSGGQEAAPHSKLVSGCVHFRIALLSNLQYRTNCAES